jgi:hypothetical protein
MAMRVHAQRDVIKNDVPGLELGPLHVVGDLIDPRDVPDRIKWRTKGKRDETVLGLGKTELK